MIYRQFVLSCFVLFLSMACWAEKTAKCAYLESAVRLQVLEVNYCLELHSSNKSGSRQYVRYLRRTLRNTSPEPIETSFITDLTFSLVIGSEVMIESRAIKVPVTDSEEAKDWQIPYAVTRLAPGESQEQRYRLSDFMIEKPKSKRLYSISLDPTIAFRFLNEPDSKFAERMHWTKEDDEKGSRPFSPSRFKRFQIQAKSAVQRFLCAFSIFQRRQQTLFLIRLQQHFNCLIVK